MDVERCLATVLELVPLEKARGHLQAALPPFPRAAVARRRLEGLDTCIMSARRHHAAGGRFTFERFTLGEKRHESPTDQVNVAPLGLLPNDRHLGRRRDIPRFKERRLVPQHPFAFNRRLDAAYVPAAHQRARFNAMMGICSSPTSSTSLSSMKSRVAQ